MSDNGRELLREMWRDFREYRAVWWAFAAGLGLVLLLGNAGWVFSSWQEAKAFNRLTGKQATTWDAMWVQLRVDDD